MQHLVDDVRKAVDAQCWYAALTLALVLPDACAKIDLPGQNVGSRYVAWAGRYFVPYVTAGGRPFVTGRELYRLRCAFCHAGDLEVEDHVPVEAEPGEAMFEVLNEVVLFANAVVPSRAMSSSNEARRTSYVVSVGELCGWICSAAEDWLEVARQDAGRTAAIGRLRRIVWMNRDATRTPI